jgi:hypothetical protein
MAPKKAQSNYEMVSEDGREPLRHAVPVQIQHV